MQIARFLHPEKKIPLFGVIKGDIIEEISDPFGEIKEEGRVFSRGTVKLLSPTLPSKIVAVGLNYRHHAQELEERIPENPIIFIKPSTAVLDPDDFILLPSSSCQVDYEGELAVVIKKKAYKVKDSHFGEYVLGYTCFNDVTARDLQKKDGQWTRAKSFNTFAPFGPWIETEIEPGNLNIRTYVNGYKKQDSNTKELLFPVPMLISFISEVMTLLPGDVIATGTPEGVGPLHPGDIVEIEIENIGILRNPVKGE
ncbi:MAG TPA: fumarylacetoacetate hydrolase family protein [Candidatus Atribacteria bacterium]|nr:fumarylacetoacetate hydrolase family protein [Candidatus Atribacteria bacterium]